MKFNLYIFSISSQFHATWQSISLLVWNCQLSLVFRKFPVSVNQSSSQGRAVLGETCDSLSRSYCSAHPYFCNICASVLLESLDLHQKSLVWYNFVDVLDPGTWLPGISSSIWSLGNHHWRMFAWCRQVCGRLVSFRHGLRHAGFLHEPTIWIPRGLHQGRRTQSQ